eukprot:TRINITY_DN6048_c0_g1_i3.p4 TRINITY_DN6048_c0_g1~~TRINITY_DN6048_c0_g1_i3.p4  ORF type:complete len:148 (-),score=20.96 TRINITY_DN6048_c0_g1_i3:1563-2006(-)
MKFGSVLLLVVLAVCRVQGVCIESARGNVLGAKSSLELFSTKSCGTYEEWNLIPTNTSTHIYIQHVQTSAYLIAQVDGVLSLIIPTAGTLNVDYEWIEQETFADSGVFTYQGVVTGDFLRVDSDGVGLDSIDTSLGTSLDNDFIKRV